MAFLDETGLTELWACTKEQVERVEQAANIYASVESGFGGTIEHSSVSGSIKLGGTDVRATMNAVPDSKELIFINSIDWTYSGNGGASGQMAGTHTGVFRAELILNGVAFVVAEWEYSYPAIPASNVYDKLNALTDININTYALFGKTLTSDDELIVNLVDIVDSCPTNFNGTSTISGATLRGRFKEASA